MIILCDSGFIRIHQDIRYLSKQEKALADNDAQRETGVIHDRDRDNEDTIRSNLRYRRREQGFHRQQHRIEILTVEKK